MELPHGCQSQMKPELQSSGDCPSISVFCVLPRGRRVATRAAGATLRPRRTGACQGPGPPNCRGRTDGTAVHGPAAAAIVGAGTRPAPTTALARRINLLRSPRLQAPPLHCADRRVRAVGDGPDRVMSGGEGGREGVRGQTVRFTYSSSADGTRTAPAAAPPHRERRSCNSSVVRAQSRGGSTDGVAEPDRRATCSGRSDGEVVKKRPWGPPRISTGLAASCLKLIVPPGGPRSNAGWRQGAAAAVLLPAWLARREPRTGSGGVAGGRWRRVGTCRRDPLLVVQGSPWCVRSCGATCKSPHAPWSSRVCKADDRTLARASPPQTASLGRVV